MPHVLALRAIQAPCSTACGEKHGPVPFSRVQVPSDQNIPFNEKPEMKSKEITKLGIEALKSGKYDQVWQPPPILLVRQAVGCWCLVLDSPEPISKHAMAEDADMRL